MKIFKQTRYSKITSAFRERLKAFDKFTKGTVEIPVKALNIFMSYAKAKFLSLNLYDISPFNLTRADEKPGKENCHSDGTYASCADHERMRHRFVSERLKVAVD